MGEAFIKTIRFLKENVSPRVSDWEWQNIHSNEYPNAPHSMVPFLRPFFHRSVPLGGNFNTVAVSKYDVKKFFKDNRFNSGHTSTYRQVVDFDADVSQFSLESGQHGNWFGGHYFDMQERHQSGDLYKMVINRNEIKAKSYPALYLKHPSEDPKSTQTFKEEM